MFKPNTDYGNSLTLHSRTKHVFQNKQISIMTRTKSRQLNHHIFLVKVFTNPQSVSPKYKTIEGYR